MQPPIAKTIACRATVPGMSYLSSTGLAVPRTADFVTAIRAAIEDELGITVDWSSNVVLAQLVNVFAQELGDLSDTVQAVYDMRDLSGATGIHLDNLCALVGITRNPATKGSVTLTLTATKAVTVRQGDLVEAADYNGSRWSISEDVVFVGAGSSDVVATCTEPGAVAAPAGEIATIITPRDGWSAVTNAADATLGVDRETDAQLRKRRATALHSPGSTSVYAIRAAALAVDGVTACVVLQNSTGSSQTIEGKTLDPHSVFVVVYPDTMTSAQQDTLAAELYKHVTAGIKLMGTDVTLYVADATGANRAISWDWASALSVNVTATITLLPGYVLADVQDAVEDAIEDVFAALAPGEDLRVLALQGAISQVEGVASLSLSPSSDTTITATQVATAGTITVTT